MSKHCMSREQAVSRLRHFVATGGAECPDGYGRIGVRSGLSTIPLLSAFADWLESTTWITDYDGGRVWSYDLDSYLVEFMEEARTSPAWAERRKQMCRESSYRLMEIPDLEDCNNSDSLMIGADLARVLPLVIDQETVRDGWLEHRLLSRFGARSAVMNQSWKKFVRKCLRPMAATLKADTFRSRIGEFGGVKVTSYAMAGRVQFEFEQGDDSFTYVHDESDMTGLRSGPNFSRTDPVRCAQMIDAVVATWDFSKFKESK